MLPEIAGRPFIPGVLPSLDGRFASTVGAMKDVRILPILVVVDGHLWVIEGIDTRGPVLLQAGYYIVSR